MAVINLEKMQTDIQDIKVELKNLNPEGTSKFDWLLEDVSVRSGGIITDKEKVVKGWITEYFGMDFTCIDTNRFSKEKELKHIYINRDGTVYDVERTPIGNILNGFIIGDTYGKIVVINRNTSSATLYDTDGKIYGVYHDARLLGVGQYEGTIPDLTDSTDLSDDYADISLKSCRILNTGGIIDIDTMQEIGKLSTCIHKNLDYTGDNIKTVNHNILHKSKIHNKTLRYKDIDIGIIY